LWYDEATGSSFTVLDYEINFLSYTAT